MPDGKTITYNNDLYTYIDNQYIKQNIRRTKYYIEQITDDITFTGRQSDGVELAPNGKYYKGQAMYLSLLLYGITFHTDAKMDIQIGRRKFNIYNGSIAGTTTTSIQVSYVIIPVLARNLSHLVIRLQDKSTETIYSDDSLINITGIYGNNIAPFKLFYNHAATISSASTIDYI